MAAPGLGASAYVGWKEESVWGTGVTPDNWYRMAGGETVRWNPTFFNDPSLGDSAVLEIIKGTSTVGGDLPLPARYEGLGYLFKNLLGSVSSGIVVDGYLHTFTPDDDLPTGLTFNIYRDIPAAKSFQVVGTKLSKGVFSVERNAPLMFTPTLLGQGETLETKETPSFPTAGLMIPSQLVVTTTGDIAGTVDVLSASLEINNPLTEERFDLGASGAFKEPQRSDKRTVLGTIEGEFSEEVQYTDWTTENTGTIVFTWTGALIGTDYYKLVITINAKMTARPPQVTDAGPVRMTLNFQGFKSGSTDDIKIELTNTVTSFP